MEATAASVGIAMSIWEIVLIFAFKKVLFSMFVLILSLQFLVYISFWNVMYPINTHFVLHELKRIAIGELFEGLEIGTTISETLGIESNESSAVDEKVGEERLSKGSFSAGIGPTLILLSAIFIFLLVLVAIILIICKRCKPSEK